MVQGFVHCFFGTLLTLKSLVVDLHLPNIEDLMDPELYANVQRTKRLFGKVARELEPGVCLFEGVELFL